MQGTKFIKKNKKIYQYYAYYHLVLRYMYYQLLFQEAYFEAKREVDVSQLKDLKRKLDDRRKKRVSSGC